MVFITSGHHLTEFNLLNEAIKLLFYIVFNIYGLIHIYFKCFCKLLWFWITNIKYFFFRVLGIYDVTDAVPQKLRQMSLLSNPKIRASLSLSL